MTDKLSSTEETVVNGDIVTTVTKTKTLNPDHTVTTTTTIDKTDHADEDNHTTTLNQTTTATPADLDKQIIRQIEYYFSDVNMIRDKFLQNEIIKDEGWIPLSILTTFKRLQSLTTDCKTIMNALKNSVSGLLQLNEDENKIRRHPDRPIPRSQAELELTLRNRTVYVEGFPKTADVTLDKLLHFFEHYGSTDNIQMKREAKSKDFSGSVFVVFPSEEKAHDFVENSKRIPIKYVDGSILECSLQNQIVTRGKEKQAKKDKKQEELNKQTNEHLEKLNNENFLGAVIHLAGMAAGATRELIKEKFLPFTKMPWIDFNRGDPEAWVRLNEANTAKDVLGKVLAAGNGKLVIGDKEVTSRIVEGEEEVQFWKEANEKRAAQRTKNNERFSAGKRSGFNKKKRRGGQKRKNNRDQDDESDDNPSTESKKVKTTD